jgi:hypothetical protein
MSFFILSICFCYFIVFWEHEFEAGLLKLIRISLSSICVFSVLLELFIQLLPRVFHSLFVFHENHLEFTFFFVSFPWFF